MMNVSLVDSDGNDISPKVAISDESAHGHSVPQRRTQRAKTLGAELSMQVSVAVVAPGGGTGVNASVYQSLGQKEGISVQIVGQSRAPYDRYPQCFANDGAPAPNLESFALDVVAQGCLERTDCLVVGSRGGQVVLPTFWKARGEDVPPAVVMNGGCAMSLPFQVQWPINAITFLLLGGNDYFRGQISANQYLANAQQLVPDANTTTAILLVNEMSHMPQAQMLSAILPTMIRALMSWKSTDVVPIDDFATVLVNLRRGGWSGRLTYKTQPGLPWKSEAFP
jgi:hypothetical protein